MLAALPDQCTLARFMPWKPTHIALAIGGAVLLLIPASQWYGRRVAYRSLAYLEIARRNEGWWSVWRRLLRMPQHWFELFRSSAGIACLLWALRAVATENVSMNLVAPWWLREEAAVAVAAAGLVLMLVTFRKVEGLLAPVVFVTGVVAVAAPWMLAALALVLAYAVMFATRQLGLFFATLAAGLAGLGSLIAKNLTVPAATAAFAIIPVAAAFVSNRELVLAVRRSRSGTDGA